MRTDHAFRTACDLEQAGDIERAATLYRMILANQEDARAAVNLGVIHFNRKEYGQAADLYRKATEIAPEYALAWFDLGNACDELLNLAEAIKAYTTALRLNPQYADAHYNLALALEVKRESRRALKHWRAYVRLDSTGPHADHARRAIRKTVKADALKIVYRRAA